MMTTSRHFTLLLLTIACLTNLLTASEVTLTAEYQQETLIGGLAAARVMVPTDGSVDGTWNQLGFDDSSWQSGFGGAGYNAYSQDSDLWWPYIVDWTSSPKPMSPE